MAIVAIKSAFRIVSREVKVHGHITSLPKSDTPDFTRGTMYSQCLIWHRHDQTQLRWVQQCYWSMVSTSIRKWGSSPLTGESQMTCGPDVMAWKGLLIQQDLPDLLFPELKLRAPAHQCPPGPLGFQ